MGVVHQTDCFITRCIIYSCTRGWCSHLLPLPTAGFIPLGGFSLLPQPFIQDTEHKRPFFYLYYIYVCICIHTHKTHTYIYGSCALDEHDTLVQWYIHTFKIQLNRTKRTQMVLLTPKIFPLFDGKAVFFLKKWNRNVFDIISFFIF